MRNCKLLRKLQKLKGFKKYNKNSFLDFRVEIVKLSLSFGLKLGRTYLLVFGLFKNH